MGFVVGKLALAQHFFPITSVFPIQYHSAIAPYGFVNRVNDAIQGDSGGICSIFGNDSMCDSKQRSSYEHGPYFERLLRYGKKKIRTILRARTAVT